MKKYIHRVNYYETDKMGITHHSNYIRFMEEARMDFLAELGYPMTKMEELGLNSPVVSVSCDYKRTTTFSDEIEIEVTVTQYTGVRLKLSYIMRAAGVVAAQAVSEHCFLNENGRPVALKKYVPGLDEALRALV
ncbi:MAG: acyl-CoA thioesterase [Oscillospiraceae bacterium]|nr:acyl-CoA thioesterase [Oscillospiraceae bacterium]